MELVFKVEVDAQEEDEVALDYLNEIQKVFISIVGLSDFALQTVTSSQIEGYNAGMSR
jgi:hypothetical protein